MPTNTTTYSFVKPSVGGDINAWGGFHNDNLDLLDDLLDGTEPITGIDINSGIIDDTPIGATTPSTGRFSSLTLDTALAVAQGGTGATTAAAARTALDVQQLNARLTGLAGNSIEGDLVRVNDAGDDVEGIPYATGDDFTISPAAVTRRADIADYVAAQLSGLPVLLASQDLSAVSQFEFTAFDNTLYIGYRWEFSNLLLPVIVRTSSDGVSYDNGTADYAYKQTGASTLATTGTGGVPITGLPAAMSIGMSGRMWHNPIVGGAREPIFRCELESSDSADTNADYLNTYFRRNSNYEVQGVRLETSTGGNFVAGHVTVMGIPK